MSVLSFSASAADAPANPFAPPGHGAPPPAPPAPSILDKIEFRGILTIGDTTLVTLFDTSTSKSFTVEIGETRNDIKVTDYRMTNDADTVQITQGAESKRISLRKPKIVAMAAQPVAPPPGGAQPAQGASAAETAQSANPGIAKMSDQEVRQRMQRVAEEIRRRRAMRREALQNSQQGTP